MRKSGNIFRGIIKSRIWPVMLLLFLNTKSSFSQNSIITIRQQFKTYASNNYQEKVFLHTDKSVYASGEIIWFKAYVTNVNNNNFSSLSKICYVEVVSADKKALLQGKIDIDSGRGNGSFLIPSSIRTGNYTIRAYTNWMKNFDPQFYFEENITIINPNKKPEHKNADNSLKPFVQFFPEGGNLVYGLNSTVGFKIINANGKGVDANGFVIDENNDTLALFETGKFGMGTFSFTPVTGHKYHSITRFQDSTFTDTLPPIYNNGWVMHLEDKGEALLIKVSCNIETEQDAFLFAQARDSITFANMQPLNNGVADFSINKSKLPEGISQITLFNANRQPVCERLYFKRPEHLLQIKLSNVQQEYHQRSKVDINVSAGEPNGKPVDANMSVSVYLLDSLQPEQKTNLLNYLWLASDIKGTIESPGYYFEKTEPGVNKAADNLMLTQGWRRFNWADVLSNKKSSFTFLPEHDGHIITGKISPKTQGIPDTGITVFLSVPGKNFGFASATSLASGLIRFNVEKFYGNRQIVVATNTSDSNYRILMDEPFSDQYSAITLPALHLNANLSNEISLRSTGAQAQNIYEPAKAEQFVLPQSYDSTAFFGNPSKRYYLDAYTRFPTMEEVIREYVKEVHLKKRDRNFHFEVFDEPDISYFNNEPLVLMDGVPVFDNNKIIDIDPLKIKKIDVITTRFYKGPHQYNGIVSFSTYNGDLNGYQLDPNSLVVEYDGLQYEREFYSPKYETILQIARRLPDYRNVLYWSPDVEGKTANGKFSFYTSDIPGKYIVFIQGISNSGFAGFSSTYFNVLPLHP